MKNTPPATGTACDADDASVRVGIPAAFRITSFVRVDFGAKKAELTIEVDGLAKIECEYFVPVNGKPPFAIGKSIRSKYTGAYERVIRLDPGFAAALRDAVEARLNAESQ